MINLDSIKFAKLCKPYYKEYRDIFGYVPCRSDFACNQDEYLNALTKAISEKKELSKILRVKKKDYDNPNIRY